MSHLRVLCGPCVRLQSLPPGLSAVSVQTQDLASNTQKVLLPLGAFVVESGLASVTAEWPREDLLKGRWVRSGLKESESIFQER